MPEILEMEHSRLSENTLVPAIGIVIEKIFVFLLYLYIIMSVVEKVWPGFVSNTFNLDYLLLFLLVSGVINVFFRPHLENSAKTNHFTSWKNYSVIFSLALLGTLLVFFNIRDFVELAGIVSVLVYCSLVIFGYAIIKNIKSIS